MQTRSALLFLSSILLSAACASESAEDDEVVGQSSDPLKDHDACKAHRGFLRDALAKRGSVWDDGDWDDASLDSTDYAGETKEVRRGRRAFNDRKLRGLHANGRACADCHMASNSYQLSPALAKARFDALQACRKKDKHADDPLFRPIDADDFRTNGNEAKDFSNLTENGLIRITFALPANTRLLDATNTPTTETFADVWRMVPSVSNVAITGPDGQPPPWPRGPNERGGYQLDARIDTLQNQAFAALTAHAQISGTPAQAFLDNVSAFQKTVFSSQGVANLADAIANGVTPLPDPDPVLNELEQQGKAVFNRACATCHGGSGQSTPFISPPGLPPLPRYHDISTACPRPVDAAVPARFQFKQCDAKLAKNIRTYAFTFTNPDGTQVVNVRRSSDPGRALITGFVGGANPLLDDFQKLDNPGLRGISKTAPYFHNNSAATLEEVLDHYTEFFKRARTLNAAAPILNTTTPGQFDRPFTLEERPALLAYLRKL